MAPTLLSNTLNEPSLVHFSSLLALIDVQFQFVFAPSTPSSSGSVRSPPIKASVPVPSTSTEYLQVDEKNKKVKFVRVPKFEEVPYPVVMEPNLVIEYYSR